MNDAAGKIGTRTGQTFGEAPSFLATRAEGRDDQGFFGEPEPHNRTGGARRFVCPHCDSIIYSRKNKLCGVCAEALPAELLFSEFEAERVQMLLHAEKLRHRVWMTRGGRR